ncbi:MAG: pyridoxamine 5'-phosphate oxidase family protein [Firmicutes bacterium]|nr:pyridoxamine 5'-phosphate oxidase family protein [Bacillota bacterium]
MREMRRFKQLLSAEDTAAILKRNTNGVLAVMGDEGYPYAVPVSYVYEEGKIYFHSGKQGHKMDALRSSEKVSFCVVDTDQIVPEEYTTYFRSVIAFGKPRIVEEDGEKLHALQILGRKYHPAGTEEYLNHYIQKEYAPVCIVAIDIDHMTGKEAIEFVRAKEGQR